MSKDRLIELCQQAGIPEDHIRDIGDYRDKVHSIHLCLPPHARMGGMDIHIVMDNPRDFNFINMPLSVDQMPPMLDLISKAIELIDLIQAELSPAP